ncbi:MAG: type II toxin-antitoxin system RelB/DinJ family antitoxin [Oscillospiraceae bacterium]|nr:type II toxin-antitoxin system RelB/DinJ family antitoxin [Oscillospiraceae bacterium]
MATVSTRVDDSVKAVTEQVSEAIGLSLSTAVNIFLRRFAVERGFPFDVVDPAGAESGAKPRPDRAELERRMRLAVSKGDGASGRAPSDHFTYPDPDTGRPVTVR